MQQLATELSIKPHRRQHKENKLGLSELYGAGSFTSDRVNRSHRELSDIPAVNKELKWMKTIRKDGFPDVSGFLYSLLEWTETELTQSLCRLNRCLLSQCTTLTFCRFRYDVQVSSRPDSLGWSLTNTFSAVYRDVERLIFNRLLWCKYLILLVTLWKHTIFTKLIRLFI